MTPELVELPLTGAVSFGLPLQYVGGIGWVVLGDASDATYGQLSGESPPSYACVIATMPAPARGRVLTLREIRVRARARRELPGSPPAYPATTYRVGIRQDGVAAWGSTWSLSGFDFAEAEHIFATNTVKGRAWLPSDLESLRILVELAVASGTPGTASIVSRLRVWAYVDNGVRRAAVSGSSRMVATGSGCLVLSEV